MNASGCREWERQVEVLPRVRESESDVGLVFVIVPCLFLYCLLFVLCAALLYRRVFLFSTEGTVSIPELP